MRDFYHSIPVKREIIVFILLFAVAIGLRTLYLGADPPNGITFSQGIETDPPQYTIFARNDIQQGDWNPYHDNRYITYQFSLISLFSRIVYGVFGVGTAQADLTAVILSLLTMLMFYFIIRKSSGNSHALLMLFFLAVNFLYIFFGRRSFLEVGMNFLFVAGLLSLAFWERRLIGHILWGLLTAAAIFFGKIIGLAFLFAPLVYYAYRIFRLKDKSAWKHLIGMGGGFITCALIWYLAVFSPNSEAVTGYVGEQAFGLYGMPEGFKSVYHFFMKFFTFTKDSGFLDHMPAIGVGAAIGLLFLGSFMFQKPKPQLDQRFSNTILIAVGAWLVGVYLAQMPLTYQPVRYQISMVFPLSALTAVAIIYFARRESFFLNFRSVTFTIGAFIISLLIIYQIAVAVGHKFGARVYFNSYFPYVIGIVAPLFVIAYIVIRKRGEWELQIPKFARYWLIILLLLVSVIYNTRNYVDWAKAPLYTARQASLDLGMIVSPAAVISGPFGPTLALENSLGCVIHIFGTSRPDSLLFQKYPITHLALEKSNEEAARELYPDIMEKAKLVCKYYINCRKISIYRIAYITGNRQAAQYFPSVFEQAIMFYDKGIIDSADFYLDRFQRIYPENIAGNKQATFKDLVLGNYDAAIEAARNAAAFSPTDFSLHYALNKAYIAKAEETGDESYRELAQEARKLATRYNLGYVNFDDEYDNDANQEDINESDTLSQ
ncbi:MAG: hypothetical protein R3F48_08075 [Candidatus Zixiibacteriota bacterium]